MSIELNYTFRQFGGENSLCFHSSIEKNHYNQITKDRYFEAESIDMSANS